MILSDSGIRQALKNGDLEIDPSPAEDQYTTSAVDLFLGTDFRVWDCARLDVPGVRVELNLAEQQFQRTAAAYLMAAARDPDGSLVLGPYASTPLLGITRERVHLRPSGC
jgi:deoxycytidine triphosphate deaminase